MNNADDCIKELRSDQCQLMDLEGLGAEPLSWYLRRRSRGILRRLLRMAIRLTGGNTTRGEASEWEDNSKASEVALKVNSGDRVRVRPLEEIKLTLGEDGRCHGCAFLEPMARYCGQEFRVVRRVERFFDERRWRMLKCRNIIFLEGVYCDGSGHPDTLGCERMCFFFWRTEWVERVEKN